MKVERMSWLNSTLLGVDTARNSPLYTKKWPRNTEPLVFCIINSIDDLIIAKVDSTENEIEGIAIQGFPTLKFFKRGNKTPIEYSSGRDAESFSKFLLENVEGLKEFTESADKSETATEEKKEDL
jgi:hypothetical protein